jgi:hypothetical protein
VVKVLSPSHREHGGKATEETKSFEGNGWRLLVPKKPAQAEMNYWANH